MSDQQVYTKDELNEMSRVELRRLAVQVHGMDNKECSNTKSDELKEFILEAQEGGGGKKSSSKSSRSKGRSSSKSSGKNGQSGRASAASSRGRGRSEAKKDEEQEQEAPASTEGINIDFSAINIDFSAIEERLDAIGKTLDESNEGLAGEISEVKDQLTDVQRQMFLMFGLSVEMAKAVLEPDEVDTCLAELEEEWGKSAGNDSNGDD